MHILSEFCDSSLNLLSFSRLHLLKVLPYLSSATSYVVCKAILFLPPLLYGIAAPLHNLPGTVFPMSIFLPSSLPYGRFPQALLRSIPPFCPSSTVHSCTYTLALPSNSWLVLCLSAAILGCMLQHSAQKPLHLSDVLQLSSIVPFLLCLPCLVLFAACCQLQEYYLNHWSLAWVYYRHDYWQTGNFGQCYKMVSCIRCVSVCQGLWSA